MRLAPATFWALSLTEWRAMVEGRSGGAHTDPLARGELEQLMRDHPDG
jgi:uncharacterized phage protein (TIGR02216 family)